PRISTLSLHDALPILLLNEKVGEIKAQIIERDGQIWMVKDCPTHGHFEDLMAIDEKFLKHIEATFPGRYIAAHNDETLHNHGSRDRKSTRLNSSHLGI